VAVTKRRETGPAGIFLQFNFPTNIRPRLDGSEQILHGQKLARFHIRTGRTERIFERLSV